MYKIKKLCLHCCTSMWLHTYIIQLEEEKKNEKYLKENKTSRWLHKEGVILADVEVLLQRNFKV